MKKIKVLLVEDESVLAMVIKETLELRGFDIRVASNGVEGWSYFNYSKPDVCVIDIMMPRKDGFSLVADIRKIDVLTPVIFLTAKTMQPDVLHGFEIGGDDYMKKPFSMEELILRLKAIVKRQIAMTSTDENTLSEATSIGMYEFNYQKLELGLGGKLVSLAQREAELLQLLLQHKNDLISRRTVLLKLWGDDNYFNSRSLDVYITRLRKYFIEDPAVEIINIRGKGYKLKD